MLGSTADAEDAVQEAWLRLSRQGEGSIDDLGRWLTTVVGRICLDILRSLQGRRDEPFDSETHDEPVTSDPADDPEGEAILADSIGLSLLVVLEMLSPAERVAFVLRDVFDVPFEEIAPIVGRSVAASRQIASRARRRVQGARESDQDIRSQRHLVDAFLAAAREGNFEALLEVLDPEIVMRADDAVMAMAGGYLGGEREKRGAKAVGAVFAGGARAALPALIGGAYGLAWVQHREVRTAFVFTYGKDRITGVEMVADPYRLAGLGIEVLGKQAD
jgi:RNA polymerase sigma-70 factor (ECF subfamily)